MKVSIPKHILAPALLFTLITPSMADEKPPIVPSPSILDFTRGEGWGVALGVTAEYESAYDGSDEYEIEIEPAGAVHYRTGNHLFFWEGIELGWRGRVDEAWFLQLGLRNEPGREADDSTDGRLAGLNDQDDELVGVLEVRYALDNGWRNWVAARLMGGNSKFGALGVLAAGHRFGQHTDATGTEVFLFSTFGSSKFINKDFGITPAEALASGYPETQLDGGYRSIGITVVDRRYITEHFQLLVQGGAEYYNSQIQDGPITRKDYEFELGVSVVYQF